MTTPDPRRRRTAARLLAQRARVRRLRAAMVVVVLRGEFWVAGCCGERVDQQFCEQYGCGSIVELVAPLRALLGREPDP